MYCVLRLLGRLALVVVVVLGMPALFASAPLLHEGSLSSARCTTRSVVELAARCGSLRRLASSSCIIRWAHAEVRVVPPPLSSPLSSPSSAATGVVRVGWEVCQEEPVDEVTSVCVRCVDG